MWFRKKKKVDIPTQSKQVGSVLWPYVSNVEVPDTNAINSNFNDLNNRVEVLENNGGGGISIDEVKDYVDPKFTVVNNNFTTVSTKINNLTNSVNSNSQDINRVVGVVNNNTTKINDLTTKVNTNTTNIDRNTKNIQSNLNTINKHTSDISGNTREIQLHTNQISSLNSKVNSFHSGLTRPEVEKVIDSKFVFRESFSSNNLINVGPGKVIKVDPKTVANSRGENLGGKKVLSLICGNQCFAIYKNNTSIIVFNPGTGNESFSSFIVTYYK